MSPIRIIIGLLTAGDFTDALELETFAGNLKERYGIDIAPLWREDMTLGEIYQAAHQSV